MYGDSSIIQRTKEHCLVGVKVQPLQREDIVLILVWSMVDPSWEGDVRKDQIDYEMYIIVLVQRIKTGQMDVSSKLDQIGCSAKKW